LGLTDPAPTPEDRRPIATLTGVSFAYGAKQVLDDVTVSLPPGLSALVGVNGAGKTTLMRLLTGELRPSAGEVTVLGQPAVGTGAGKERLRVGYLPQSFGFTPRLSAEDFVAYLAWLQGVPRRRIRAASGVALERVGLAVEAKTRVGALSGGMLRRLGIAQALVSEPALLLLDEPTAGLDPAQRLALRELLVGMAGEQSILVSTHLLEDLRLSHPYVVVLDDQQVRFCGELTEFAAVDPQGDLEQAFLRIVTRVSPQGA
jgi:ABC-2 type transport system ATP-binding protein